MVKRIDDIQVIVMLEESLEYNWIQHLEIVNPPDDSELVYIQADELQPQQVNKLPDIYSGLQFHEGQ